MGLTKVPASEPKMARIVVIEDEAVVARDIIQNLAELGYEVVGHSARGEDVAALAAEHKPDLFLMDIHLAGAMDGIEAARRLRSASGPPVVFLTAYGGKETLERAKLSDPFGYIIKPFEERSLHTAIEMALYKHRAETQLRRAYEEQSAILRTALDGFFMADYQGRLLDVNESSSRMLGYTREEFLKMSLADLSIATAETKAATVEELKQRGPARFSGPQRHKDGHNIFVEMSVNYLPHAGGRIFCFARDVTERQAAEESVRALNAELESRVQARTASLETAKKEAEQATRSKAAFLATMTHELRTPLNGVIGTVETMGQTNLERDQSEMLDLIGDSAGSLLRIVDDILDFSKMEAGKLGVESVPMSIQSAVERACAVVSPLADRAGSELTLFTDPKIPGSVFGDPTRLNQVLLNLASNALKFSSKENRRSRVSMRALLESRTATEVRVRIEVRDNGIGMSEATRSLLFQSFTQGDSTISRRYGGSGLGLAISKHIVDLMGGTISVVSEPGKGSTFSVSIPFSAADQAADVEARPELAGLSCLVVSGPDGLQSDLAAYLDAGGAAIDHVPDLATARQRVNSQPNYMWVWIFDIHGDPPTVDALKAISRERAGQDIRFVLIGRGRRRTPRSIAPGVIVIDANALTRGVFLKAVAHAAGRVATENQTSPILVRRSAPTLPSREEALAQGRLLLVAEDNDVNQKVIKRQLGLLGYVADIASNGREALELWRAGSYALLLADLHMPEMDGYQLTAAIRVLEETNKHAVIIALTADVLKGGAQQCRDAGLDDYLCKPVRLSELKGMIEKWLPPLSDSSKAAKTPDVAKASAPPIPAERPIDVAVLEELVGRDPNVIREFLRAFWLSTAATTAELREAFLRQDWARVADLAHRLKSPAKSVGALPLAALCEDLEQAGRASNAAALESSLARYEIERANVENYLRQT
ncbi:MAG: response regulator [Vicinamibacteria bacterium]